MRLLSHNLLQCNVKNCASSTLPLSIHVDSSKIVPCEYRQNALVKLIPKLDWPALAMTVHKLANNEEFPKEFSPALLEDPKFLQELHRILLETHIIEGYLQCQSCGRKYPIKNGIPNMILTDEEI